MQEVENFKKYKLFESWAAASRELKPGAMLSKYCGLKKVLVLRISEGFFAMEDACPHKLVKLSKGELIDELEIECYWHKYRFNVKTGEECTGKNIRPVKTYSWSEEEDGIYLQIPEDATQDDPFSF